MNFPTHKTRGFDKILFEFLSNSYILWFCDFEPLKGYGNGLRYTKGSVIW